MPDYSSIQLRCVEDVIKAYDNWKVPAFAIRSRSQLLFSYKGDDMAEGGECLASFLELLDRSHSKASYTLCVYESLNGGRITNKTEYDGSLNFLLYEQSIEQAAGNRFESVINGLQEQIAQLKEEISSMGEKGEGSGVNGVIGQVMSNPVFAPIIGALVEKAADWLSKPKESIKEPQRGNMAIVDGISKVGEISFDVESDLRILLDSTKDFPELLHKLALLSIKKPLQYSAYITIFRGIKV